MSLKVEYKGVDITGSIEVERCWLDQYAEEHGDTIKIVFRDIKRLWDIWSPEIDDEMRISDDHADSGVQFVRGLYPSAGKYEITACSIPLSAEFKRSAGWQQVTKLQLAKDIADRHGLALKTYGITDHKFSYLRQETESDLFFFQKLCNLEGDSFIIYDKELVLYNNEYLEGIEPTKTLTVKAENKPEYLNEKTITALTIKNGSVEYTVGTDMSRTKLINLPIYIDSPGTAERYAKNLFRFITRKQKTGVFYASPIAEGFTAGSVININAEDAKSFSGKVFMYHVRHDLRQNKTKIFYRCL